MLEFPGQVLELSMPVGRGTKAPLGHLWVQAWTDNDYLNLRGLLRALFNIISSSGSVNISCSRISSKTTVRIF